MTKKDHELKLLARAHMREAYANGHKVSFRKGKLFIDAKEVPIKSTLCGNVCNQILDIHNTGDKNHMLFIS